MTSISQQWLGGKSKSLQSSSSPYKRVQVVSCILPSGQNWLFNILLDLGVFCFYAGHGSWANPTTGCRKPGSLHFLNNYHTGLPALEKLASKEGDIFKQGIGIEFSHTAPSGGYLGVDTVLWYRHLAGTLYSTFRRHPNEVRGRTVYEFLTQRPSWLGLGYADAWALFYCLWLSCFSGARGMSISFDFCKKNPLPGVRSVLDFLSISASDSAIIEAVRGSEVKALLKNAPGWNCYYRAGDPDEFREVWTEELDVLLQGAPKLVMGHLEGEGDLAIAKMPMPYIVRLIEQFADAEMPADVTEYLLAGSFAEAYTQALAQTSNLACKFVQLVDRITSDLLNSALHPHPHYADPRLENMFKATAFCLAQPVDKDRVLDLVTSLQPPPLFDRLMVSGQPASISHRPLKLEGT